VHLLRSRVAIAITIVSIVVAVYAQPIALAGINMYQLALAPLTERVGMTCRFAPSCSHYAEAVIARDGAVRGGWLALKRIARCNPATPMGTVDDP
jgi:putative membrane protein insertion efficiency factor